MRNSTIITWGDGEVTVKELTVGELDQLLLQAQRPPSMLDDLLDRHFLTGALLAMATGMKEETLSGCTPSALQPLVDAFATVNPDFLAAARAKVDRVKEMAAMLARS